MRPPTDLSRLAHAGKGSAPRLYRMHRRVSVHITRALLRTGIGADTVTLTMMAVTGAGTLLVASPWTLAIAGGAILLYAGFLLDKVDGELARCRGTTSVRGILLDRLHHRIFEPGLYAAAAVHALRRDGDPSALVAAAACMLFANAIEENQQLAPYILHKHLREGGSLPPAPRAPWRWRRMRRRLRPLKALRMHIVTLPLVLLAFLCEAASGWPVTRVYLEGCAALLAFYLLFQCVDLASARIQLETRQVAASLALAGAGADELTPRRAPGVPDASSAPSHVATRSPGSTPDRSRDA